MKLICSIVRSLVLFSFFTQAQQTITVLGSGYVGLVTGTCLAELNKNKDMRVICADIDSAKINLLREGKVPIYEPGLKELISEHVQRKALFFSNNIPTSIEEADIIFIAVGTPTQKNGDVNLSYLENCLDTIATCISTTSKTIVIKSTIPIGTCRKVSSFFHSRHIQPDLYRIIFNPEFLREGTAINDFLNPDRIVVGVISDTDAKLMRELYNPLILGGIPFIVTDLETAETIKYASNSFLALKLSFINEIATMCEATGAHINQVSHAIGLDPRIGPYFLKPGPGYGGSCLPKDTKALIAIAKKLGIKLRTINAAIKANKHKKRATFKKLKRAFEGNFSNKTVTLLGLAFKANTDDIRYSPAIPLIKKLLQHGIHVKVYDPAAMNNMKLLFPTLTYCDSAEEAIQQSNALILLTDWPEFKNITVKVNHKNNSQIIIDPRHILSQKEICL